MTLVLNEVQHVIVGLSPNVTPNVYCYVRPSGEREEKRFKVDYWAVVHSIDPRSQQMSPGIHPVRWNGERLDVLIGARIVQDTEFATVDANPVCESCARTMIMRCPCCDNDE